MLIASAYRGARAHDAHLEELYFATVSSPDIRLTEPAMESRQGAEIAAQGAIHADFGSSTSEFFPMPPSGSFVFMPGSPKARIEPSLFDSIEYPTNKDELLKRAKERNAPDTVRVAIGRLQSGTFHSRGELIAAVEAIMTT